MDLQGKRKSSQGQKGKGKAAGLADEVLSSFPPYYQAARTHDRTETEIDFPVGLTPQPSIFVPAIVHIISIRCPYDGLHLILTTRLTFFSSLRFPFGFPSVMRVFPSVPRVAEKGPLTMIFHFPSVPLRLSFGYAGLLQVSEK